MTEPKRDGTFASLHTRNFRLFFTGQMISNSGNWLTMVALTLLVLHRTGRGIAVGALSACQFGPILVLSPWAGAFIDRREKRRLLLVTQSLAMAQSFVLAALAFAHGAPLIAFYATALAGGCVLAIDNPVRRTFITEMVSKDDLANAVSLNTVVVSLGRIFGPALAALLVASVGFGWCFTIDGLTYLVVLTMIAMMRTSELHAAPSKAKRGGAQVRAGLRYVRDVTDLRISFLMLLIIGTVSYNFTVVMPLFIERSLHGADGDYGRVFAVVSVGALAGSLRAARRRNVTITTTIVGAVALGTSMLAFAAVPNVAMAYAVALLLGVSSVTYMTSTTAFAQLRADPQMMGRVVSLQTVLVAGTTPIGGPILGAVADVLGERAPLIVGGVAAIGAATYGWVANQRAGAPAAAPVG